MQMFNKHIETPEYKQLPVLVYGTLRPTGGNYEYFLQGDTACEETVTLDGYTMYGGENAGFPYVTVGDSSIVGTLITLSPERYDAAMESLDFLEGFRGVDKPSHYQRKMVQIKNNAGETVEAWMYLVEGLEAARIKATTPLTKNGDWIAQQANRKKKVGASFKK